MKQITPPYKVIRSRRRKTAQITIKAEAVEVRVPDKTSDRWIMELLDLRKEWVQKKWQIAYGNAQKFCLKTIKGQRFPYLGAEYVLDWYVGDRNQVSIVADNLLVELSPRSKKAQEEQVKKLLTEWFRKQAGLVLKERMEYWQNEMGLYSNKLIIKGFKRRWGSCSSLGEVTLNWKLVFMPYEIMDYVVIHELAHLVHHNHGHEFWKLVAEFCPDWKEKRGELNKRSEVLKW